MPLFSMILSVNLICENVDHIRFSMTRPGSKLEATATPKVELADDDLSYLRGMIERAPAPAEPIDFTFLRDELSKRRPPLPPPFKGIATVDPQTQPPTRGPRYMKGIPQRSTFVEPHFESDDFGLEIQHIEKSGSDLSDSSVSPSRIRKPEKYVCWKYIGDTDETFGCLTGKLNAHKSPRILAREFAALPYELDRYHIEKQPPMPPPKVRPRDLFSMSIKEGTREQARRRTISRLNDKQTKAAETDTQLFLETETKMIPLMASRLKGRK
jgi:hypothetical protein